MIYCISNIGGDLSPSMCIKLLYGLDKTPETLSVRPLQCETAPLFLIPRMSLKQYFIKNMLISCDFRGGSQVFSRNYPCLQ